MNIIFIKKHPAGILKGEVRGVKPNFGKRMVSEKFATIFEGTKEDAEKANAAVYAKAKPPVPVTAKRDAKPSKKEIKEANDKD